MATQESEYVFGVRAALAVFAMRAEDIVEVAFCPEVRDVAASLLDWCEREGCVVHEMSERELAESVHSDHHEGLCLMTKPRRWTAAAELARILRGQVGVDTTASRASMVRRSAEASKMPPSGAPARLPKAGAGLAVAFDRVRNPYNVGAILRTAAFLEFDAAILGAPAPHPALAEDAVRVAEGGAECLALSRTTDLAVTLRKLREQGVTIYCGESDVETNAIGHAFKRPAVLVVGHEREGVSERVRAECDVAVRIPGGGVVGSLNVSVAASMLMLEMTRTSL